MYEAVGPFFPFVRYAAFMLVIRSLLAERSLLLQKCVAIFGEHVYHFILFGFLVKIRYSSYRLTCRTLSVGCKGHFSFDLIFFRGPVGPGFDLIWRVIP